MAAFHGRAVIIRLGAIDLADELRTKGVTFNGELVDITTDADDGNTTTMDEIFNTFNVTVSLEGIMKSDQLSNMAFNGTQEAMTIVLGTLFQLTGVFQFQPGFNIGAPYNLEATFSGTLQSSGAVTKGPVV